MKCTCVGRKTKHWGGMCVSETTPHVHSHRDYIAVGFIYVCACEMNPCILMPG